MSLLINNLYEFGEFRIDTKERTLVRDHEPVELTPKAFELLSVFIENHGRLIEKDELMSKVWGDSFVEESNLTFNIRQLRKILGDHAQRPTYIKTVPRHGYRFIAPVTVPEPDLPEPAVERPVEIRPREANVRNTSGRPVFYSAVLLLAVTFLLTAGFFAYEHRPSGWKNGPNAAGAELRDLSYEQIVKSG